MTLRKASLLAFILLLTLSCRGNNNQLSSHDIAAKDTININIGSEPPSLDWSLATDSTSYLILNNVMQGLTRFGDDYKPEPALAEKWEVSDDGKTYTFHIRKNVFWSDGKPLKAGDFEYSWKRILDPETAGDYAYFLYDIENAEEFNTGNLADPEKLGVKAINDHVLVVSLKHAAAYFPSLLTFMSTFPMRKDVVEKYGLKWTEPENIVTLGAYSLSSWRHHEAILLVKNPNYWGEKPRVKFVKMIMNENPTSALALYESGELDYVDGSGIPVLEIPRLRLLPDFSTQLQFRGNYVAFNVKKPPFNNPLVRKAFSGAIDRDSMVNLTQGAGIPATSWIPKGMLGYAPKIGIGFNPAQARAWLSKAGYPDGEGFPRVTFLYPDVTNNRIIAEALQSMWKKHLGVDVELSNQEWKVYLSTINTDPPEIHRAGWGADFPDPHNFMNLFECNSGNNRTQWCNDKYDQLVENAAQEIDHLKRKAIYDKAQEILTEEDVPIAPFLISIQQSMVKPYVAGLKPNPLGIILFNRVHFIDNNKRTE